MRNSVPPRRREEGFTLIEIMVVLAIIAALVGAGSLMIQIAQKSKAKTETQARLSALASALEQLHSSDQLGMYPPTAITKLKVSGFDGSKFGQPNTTNIGAETLYVVFKINGINVTPSNMEDETKIGNTDDDKATATANTKLAKSDLFEYLDAWGNPIVYLNSADYKDVSKVDEYKTKDGETVKVKAKKNDKTGEYVHADTYQLMSMGPDGKPDTEDDLMFGM